MPSAGIAAGSDSCGAITRGGPGSHVSKSSGASGRVRWYS